MKRCFGIWIGFTLTAGVAAFGQLPGGPGSVNSALARLFGNTTAFSAKVEVQVLDQNQQEWMRMPMDFAMLDGKLRADIDLGQLKSRQPAADTIASYKQAGLDQVSSVLRPDRMAMYIIYPRAKSYVNLAMSKEEAAASGSNLKLEKTALGNETVAKHPCVKNRVLVKDSKGAVLLEAVTWNATDLKDFPVQIATKENGNATIMRLHQVRLAKPDAKQFDPPAGFAKYDTTEALLFAASKRVYDASVKKSPSR